MAFGHRIQPFNEPKSDINMIPFIDVMLVLLIIFMLTVPVVTHQIRVELPSTNNADQNTIHQPILLNIKADQRIWFNDKELTLNELPNYLSTIDPNTPLQLAGDKQITYELLAQVMSEIQKSGLTKVELLTQMH